MAAEISVANGWDAPSDDTLLGPCAFSRFLRIFAWLRKHLWACAKVAKKNGRKNGRWRCQKLEQKWAHQKWAHLLGLDVVCKHDYQKKLSTILFQNHVFRYISDSMTGSGSGNWRSKVVAPKCSFRITFLDTLLTQCLEAVLKMAKKLRGDSHAESRL